jgi:RepB DNA-primase N-terminal domain
MQQQFIHKLHEHCEGRIELRPIPGQRDFIAPSDHSGIELHCRRNKGTNIFFGVATRDGLGGKKDNIVDIPAVWADVDFKDTPKERLGKNLENFPYKPSAIVLSGGGVHLYWLFNEPANKNDINVVEDINRRITQAIGADNNSTDASRVLRMPGSLNYKYDPPRPVMLHRMESFVYHPADFLDLPEAPRKTTYAGNKHYGENIFKCDFIRWCKDHQGDVNEPLWYAMISNLICIRPGGVSLCHELSKKYPKYTIAETNQKILKALDSSGPHTCGFIKQNGYKCRKACHVKAPAGLTYKNSGDPNNEQRKRITISYHRA